MVGPVFQSLVDPPGVADFSSPRCLSPGLTTHHLLNVMWNLESPMLCYRIIVDQRSIVIWKARWVSHGCYIICNSTLTMRAFWGILWVGTSHQPCKILFTRSIDFLRGHSKSHSRRWMGKTIQISLSFLCQEKPSESRNFTLDKLVQLCQEPVNQQVVFLFILSSILNSELHPCWWRGFPCQVPGLLSSTNWPSLQLLRFHWFWLHLLPGHQEMFKFSSF